MNVYYYTIFSVLFFCMLAENMDVLQYYDSASGKVRHTSSAGRFYFIAASILVCTAGLRYRVGSDYGGYYLDYERYASQLWDSLRTFGEPGYPLLAWIATKTTNDGATAIFLASLVTVGLPLIVIYRNCRELLFPTALLVFLGYWHGSFNGVRQYLAAAILFCSYRFLKEKKYVPFIAVVLLATLCHRSAVVMAALGLVAHRKVNLRNIIIIIIATFFLLRAYDRIFLFANWVMESDFSIENTYTSTSVNVLRIIAACSPMALFLPYYLPREKSKDDEFLLNLVTVHAAIRIVTMNSALLYRVGIYTIAFQAIAIPELLEKFEERERYLLKMSMLLLYAFYWWYEVHRSSALNTFLWIWQR